MVRKYVKTRGVEELAAELTRLGNVSREDTRSVVKVGYSVHYALPVHEKVEMLWAGLPRRSGIGVYWGPSGKAKFLEDPAQDNKEEIADRIAEVTRNTHSLTRGMYSGGVLLRQFSLEQVPVEYGLLRDSVYVEVVYQ